MKNLTQIGLLVTTTLGLSFIGCSSLNNNMTINYKIKQIENNKRNHLKYKIDISDNNGYKAYIDKDNQVKFICTMDKCNYYDEKKHSYKNGTPDEEIIFFNKSGYYPPVNPKTKGSQCGTGSLWGWIAIFNISPFGIENYSKKNPIKCYSRFTQVDSTQIGNRVAVGLLTFMTPLLTAGTMHTNKFDKKGFINAVYISNIETFKDQLLTLISKYNIKGGIDVIYLEKGNIDDNLENKYDYLLKDKALKSGIIFLEKDTNRLLAIDIFSKYEDKNILQSISMQIEDIINMISSNNQYILKYEDILPYIPKEIALPKIPPIKKLLKDEFETKQQFNQIVEKAVKQREQSIRDMQRKYSLDVFERNAYIDGLQKAYEEYLEYKVEEKNQFLLKLKENIPLLSKVLFLENTSGYDAKNFKYNAEAQKLYFDIYSRKNSFNQKVVASIPANIAKEIKRNKTFKILPNIEVDKNKLILKGFQILETTSDDTFDVAYTNINFKAESVSLKVSGMKESIKKEISNHFKQYKQKDMPIVDTSKKEIWYIDVVNNINATIPKWFVNPSIDKIIGYGEGKTLEEARLQARKELSYMVKVKVNSTFSSSKDINNFKSFKEVKVQTQQSTDIVLSSSDYKIYKQEKKDGIWYVGFVYIK